MLDLRKIRELRDFLLWLQQEEFDDLSVYMESDFFDIAKEYLVEVDSDGS